MSINLSALMKQRYDTAANWTAQNPTLLAGEIGIESDTKKWKVGTGATAWTSLAYAIGGTYPIVNADIAAGAAIVDTKLATIATAGKVSNSATTAASANTASAIVARDASGNFTAGTITAALTGAASANVLKAGDTMTGVLAVTAGTAALPGIAVSGDLNTGIYSPGADQLAIATGGTGRVFVDANGDVGIGAAPNAWRPDTQALQIGSLGSAIFQISTISPSTFLTTNYYFDASNRGRYISPFNNFATQYRQISGLHTWYTAPIGRSIPVTAVTSGQQYSVTTLGTTTLAEWQVLFSALTVLPTVDQLITATASGTLPGSPAATVTQTVTFTDVMNIGNSGTTTVTAAASTAPFIAKISATEVVRIDSSGRLLVGTSTSSSVGALVQVRTGANNNHIEAIRSSDDGGGPAIWLTKSRGTAGSPTEVSNGDQLGFIVFKGHDGTDYRDAAYIYAEADGTWTDGGDTTDNPGRLVFSTTADGAASPTERMRITNAGNVGIGTPSPGYPLTVNGRISYVSAIGEGADTTLSSASTEVRIAESSTWQNLAFYTAGTQKAKIDSSGRLLVGTSSAVSNVQLGGSNFTPQMQLQGADANSSLFSLTRTAAFSPHFVFNSGSSGNNVASNSSIGTLVFNGFDGTNYVNAASINASIDGTPGANDMPGRLVFSTTADGAASPTERMRITSGGRFNNVSTEAGIFSETTQAAGTSFVVFQGRYSATAGSPLSGTTSFQVYSNGNVQNTNNSYGAISDIKLKENIVNANSQWDDLKALQVRNYNFKEGQTHTQIGLVAQEAELVSPGLVTESPDRDEDGNDLGTVTKSVHYSVLYMKAVKALQEAMGRIETLEQRLTAAGID